MKLPLLLTSAILASTFTLTTHALTSSSTDYLNSPVVINFNDFDRSGFIPTPSARKRGSNLWSIRGLSNEPLRYFGGITANSKNNFTRSSSYALDIGSGDIALGIQPSGNDWASGSTTYTQIEALDFQSHEIALNVPVCWEIPQNTTLLEFSTADSGHYDGELYDLRLSGADFSSIWSHDEFGSSNISITAVPEPAHFGLVCGLIGLFVIGKRVNRQWRITLPDKS